MANRSYAITVSLMRVCLLAARLAVDPSSTAVESMSTAGARQPAPTSLLAYDAVGQSLRAVSSVEAGLDRIPVGPLREHRCYSIKSSAEILSLGVSTPGRGAAPALTKESIVARVDRR